MLPGEAYTKGFLRTYAEFLGLNGHLYIDEYNARIARHNDEPQPLVPHASVENRRDVQRSVLVTLASIVVFGAAVAGLAAWRLGGSSTPPRQAAQPPPTGGGSVAAPATPAPATTTTATRTAPLKPAFASISAAPARPAPSSSRASSSRGRRSDSRCSRGSGCGWAARERSTSPSPGTQSPGSRPRRPTSS